MKSKCVMIDMNQARTAGLNNLESVIEFVDNLKGSTDTNGRQLLCSYTQPYFSGLVLSAGEHGEIETAGKIFIPVSKVKTVDGSEPFKKSDSVKIIELLLVGLDLIEIDWK